MRLGILSFLCLLLCSRGLSHAEELRVTVEVRAEALGESDRTRYETLQRQLSDLFNRTHWTDLVYQDEERIEATFTLILLERKGEGDYTAEVVVSARRPVYHSDYQTTTLLVRERGISFSYLAGDQLTYRETELEHSLVALVAYYSLYLIATDLDSFSPLGGSLLQPRLSTLLSTAASRPDWQGWSSSERGLSRYRRASRFLSSEEEVYRKCWYRYHRLGLDRMADAPEEARKVILDVLQELSTFAKGHFLSPSLSELESAKLPEIVELFARAPQQTRRQVLELLESLFPTASTRLQPLR